jgi:hypothetical protein
MLDLINTHGLKALSEMIKEEPDNEQFTQELKDQEAKAAGKGKKQIGYVVHNKKENTHTAYHGPQGRDDFGHIDDFPDHNKAVSQIKKSAGIKEDIQKTSTGYIHHARPGVYGGSAKEKHVVDTLRGPKKSEIEAIEKEKKMKKFSEMLDLINTHGLKALSEMIKEEPDNEQFTKELKDAQAKSEGKGKKAEVAKAAVQAVKVEEETIQVEVLDFNEVNGVKMSQLDESHLTAAQSDKKEEIVKSMKKGLSGFKARYGDRAKEVMYATATKQAKK